MKILMVRTPRYRWPFHSEASSFWQPLGFASMTAVLREEIKDVDVQILDCPILKMGWKSTQEYILNQKPDIICVGEETVSSHEAIKLVHFVKEYLPRTITVAGGPHFSYMIKDSLKNHPIDYIIRFEGEYSFLKLVKVLKTKKNPSVKDLKKVPSLAFLSSGEVIENEIGTPVDMEKLPIPAYDLLPMELYGKGASSHPDMVAIEHSRGCTCSCNFCVLWKQFGKIDLKKKKVVPCYRSKSPQKTFEEVKYLYEKYNRKTFCWVDPTWNVDPKWNEAFADILIKNNLNINHSVWMRADFIVRDEKIFEKMVKAGVKQVMIGVERTDNEDLAYLDKHGYSYNTVKRAFEIVRKYPDVLSVATYIYGIPNETKASLKRFYDLLNEIPFDIGVPIPITPNPGTKFFDDLSKEGLLEVKKFKYYNFVNPLARSKYLSRSQLLLTMLWNEFRIRTFKEQHANKKTKGRRSNATGNLAKSKTKMTINFFRGILQESFGGEVYNYNIKPEWYDN